MSAEASHTDAAAGWADIRPEVLAFAHLMEAQLRANDYKGGWKDCKPYQLWARIGEEIDELWNEIWQHGRFESPVAADPKRTGKEAADVANFAMMIADVCGALPAIARRRMAGGEGTGAAELTAEELDPHALEVAVRTYWSRATSDKDAIAKAICAYLTLTAAVARSVLAVPSQTDMHNQALEALRAAQASMASEGAGLKIVDDVLIAHGCQLAAHTPAKPDQGGEGARESLERDLATHDGGGLAYVCQDAESVCLVQAEDLRTVLAELPADTVLRSIADDLRRLTVPESPMHPIGCATWEEDARVTIWRSIDALDALTTAAPADGAPEKPPASDVGVGMMIAAAIVSSDFDNQVIAKEILGAAGVKTRADAEAFGADPYDLDRLASAFADGAPSETGEA